MPNRSLSGAETYRYGYQGEYAEKDSETGLNAFQLRMWDSRIGRWMSPDPMGQYHSPYMGMDNRPNMSVDPTGGCTVGTDCPEEFNWMGKGTWVANEVGIGGFKNTINWGSESLTGGGRTDFSKFDSSTWYQIKFPALSSISQWNPTVLDKIQMFRDKSKNGFVETIAGVAIEGTYGLVDGAYLVGSNIFSNSPRHLNGFGATDNIVAEGGMSVVIAAGSYGAGKYVQSVAQPIKSYVPLYNSLRQSPQLQGVSNEFVSGFAKESIKIHNQLLKTQFKLYNETRKGMFLYGDYSNESKK